MPHVGYGVDAQREVVEAVLGRPRGAAGGERTGTVQRARQLFPGWDVVLLGDWNLPAAAKGAPPGQKKKSRHKSKPLAMEFRDRLAALCLEIKNPRNVATHKRGGALDLDGFCIAEAATRARRTGAPGTS